MPRLALTFDDGPSPHTEVIADLIAGVIVAICTLLDV